MDVIVCHVNADFDCLGCLVGAGRLYPGAALVAPAGLAPNVHDFLALHREVIQVRDPGSVAPTAITRVVVVDTSHGNRLGPAAEWLSLPEVEIHLYDHHLSTPGDISATGGRTEAWGSASAIVAHALREQGETPSPIEATAMLLGIYEDTGSLTYDGTRPEDLKAAAWLLQMGGSLQAVAEFGQRPLSSARRELLAEMTAGLELHSIHGLDVALTTTAKREYVEDAAELVSRLLELEEVDALFALLPMQGVLHVIGRARRDGIDVGTTLRGLGGGGHVRAASASLEGADPAAIRQQLLTALPAGTRPEPTAEQLMSHPVRTIHPDASLTEAWERMVRYGHSGLVVLDEAKKNRLVGVVTRRDVDRARGHRLDHSPVRGFMTRNVHTILPQTPLSEMEDIVTREGIGRLPVVAGGQVVGVVTRTDLLKARYGHSYVRGQRSRRQKPEDSESAVRFRERMPAPMQRLLTQVGETAVAAGGAAFLVGGCVRDLLLGVPNLDVDVLVEPDAIALAESIAQALGGKVTLKVEPRFGTARITGEDYSVDFATARTETYARPGALPDVEPSSLRDDLRRRDFTINAMALSLHPEQMGALVDPFGGWSDLERRRLRILPNTLSFIEDPTRLFRAVRFEERLRFKMDEHTEELARHAVEADALASISPERLRAELHRTFGEARPVGALLRLEDLGVLVWMHSDLKLETTLIAAVPGALEWWDAHEPDPPVARIVYLAALLAPLPSEAALEVAERRLRLPPPDAERLREMLTALGKPELLPHPGEPPAETVRRLRPLSVEALTLIRAHLAASRAAPKLRELLDRYITEWRHTKLEITGDDLKALGYRAGPGMGKALRATLDARLNHQLRGREAELAHARALLDQGETDASSPKKRTTP